jgi:hypothetical protein
MFGRLFPDPRQTLLSHDIHGSMKQGHSFILLPEIVEILAKLGMF